MSALTIPVLFCPPVSIWSDWSEKTTLYLDIGKLYTKRSLSNRYFIAGANGIQMLSIPLQKGKHSGIPLKDVRIAYDEPWVRKHLQAVRSAYGKSAFFEYHFDAWQEIMQHHFEYLYELNMQMLLFCICQLKLNMNCTFSIENESHAQAEIYKMKNPMLLPENNPNSRFYQQVWDYKYGYVHNLSIMDLLFCCGPESILILNKIRQSTKN